MSAEPNPDFPNRKKDLVTRFNDDYLAALDEAKASAEQTATAGWQRLYRSRRAADLEDRRRLAKEMRLLADELEDSGLDEDQEKGLGKLKQEAQAIRGRREQFDALTVNPVVKPVRECERIVEKYRAEARRDEAEAPLHNAGLEEVLKDTIAALPVATWDEESGLVEIKERPAG